MWLSNGSFVIEGGVDEVAQGVAAPLLGHDTAIQHTKIPIVQLKTEKQQSRIRQRTAHHPDEYDI